MIEPESIPLFTGDLGQLEQRVDALGLQADGIRQAGGAAHRRFQGLSAFYRAPEAEELFASTAPARDAADGFADKVAVVAEALRTYAAAVAPIAAKLEHLKERATVFVAGLKTSGGAFDEDWTDDADMVQRHQALMHEVNVAEEAFTAAEIACHNRITALVGGTQYVMNTGAKQLRPLDAEFYGYSADVLDQAEELPWGTPVSQSHDWWDPDDYGYYAKSFLWDGLIIDNVVGTVDGLATLAGVKGWAQSKQSWEGLARVVVGAVAYSVEADTDEPAAVFSSDYVQGSKVYAKEFAKSFVAWNMWQENPARAAATVVFNGLTLGAGPLRIAAAGRAGTGAKVATAIANVGDAIDPIAASVRVTSHGIPKIAQITESLRGVGRLPELSAPHSVLEFSDGAGRSVLVVEDGRFVVVRDGEVVADAPRAERSLTTDSVPARLQTEGHELTSVGATSHTPQAAAHTGDGLPPRTGRETSSGPGDGSAPRSSTEAATGQNGAARAADAGTSGPAIGLSGSGRAGIGSGIHDSGSGLDGFGGAGAAATGDGRMAVPRPSFMHEGSNPYGPRRSLTREQVEEIQVYRANHEPGYFERHYRVDGTRKRLEVHDESGFTPPQLARLSDDTPWVPAKDTPAPPKPYFLDEKYIRVNADTITDESRLHILERAAQDRHFAIQWDNLVADLKAETGRAHQVHDTVDSAAQWGEAKGLYKESHTEMGDAAERFGEAAAEYHFVAERYPDFEKQTLLGPKNGNDQFDQVWLHDDGRVVVIEAKSSPSTELGRRTLPGGRQVSQGSREYFFDILAAMEKRGEFDLVDALEAALGEGKLNYVVVKGDKNVGTYTGYQYRRFDISKGTLP
ncbi:hypothetical protein [Streptomyces sp. NPDC059786]|uniref:hypothetical protein n=1 Tax=Streptomyces sp. NPDC059786 TaxID=3346946 RepID=UPI00364F776E